VSAPAGDASRPAPRGANIWVARREHLGGASIWAARREHLGGGGGAAGRARRMAQST
jgi:hypothetical protein